MTSVTKKMLISRRLHHSEAELWTSIPCEEIRPEDSPAANRCFASFLGMEDSLAYIGSIDGQLVGSTALYRDRKRLSVGLIAVRMPEQYRENTLQPFLKSSLPFFRTAAIREVDVLVNDESDGRPLPFPVGYELPSWTASVLREMGFQEAGKMYSCRIEDIRCQPKASAVPHYQEKPPIEDFRQLLWKNRKKSGTNCAQIGAALSLSHKLDALHQVSSASGTKAMFTLTSWDKMAKIDAVETEDASMLEDELVAGIAGMLKSRGSSSILMPMLGSGRRCVAKALADTCDSEAIFKTLKLMRKPL